MQLSLSVNAKLDPDVAGPRRSNRGEDNRFNIRRLHAVEKRCVGCETRAEYE
jgi:hypothetical protein